MELIGERLPALATAWTLNVFDIRVPCVSLSTGGGRERICERI
jgi:hypothetical protein